MADDVAGVEEVLEEEAVQEETQEQTQDPISQSKKDLGGKAGLEMKAQASVERLVRAKEKLKDIKNALKAYKVTSEPLEDLKRTRKELTQQINDEKDRIEAEFQKDQTYNKLREDVLDAEEKIAVAKQDLRVMLREQAMQNEFVELQFEINGIPFKLQSQAKVALYFNGKEEK